MDRPTFLMMIGLPCSGKSTKSIEFATEYDATVFSSDALRHELF
jgi:predicted kinase